MTITRIHTLAGLPIVYDRDPPANYGVTGYPIRPYINAVFAAETETILKDVFASLSACGVGKATAILTGGIVRAGTGNSYHHQKRAFDLDGLVFAEGPNWVADSFLQHRLIYLLIEAHLRRQFGTVLTYQYDEKHRDHIHFDNGDSIGFRPHSKSRTLFLQNALAFLFDQAVGVDGVYGPETRGAERVARDELGIGGLSKTSNWLKFLLASVEVAEERLSAPAVLEVFT